MTESDFAESLALGYEQRGIEFKGPGPRTDKHLFARVAKAMLGMANRRDGGRVIIGVDDSGGILTPKGLAPAELITWRYDHVAADLRSYADPSVSFQLRQEPYQGNSFVVIQVDEFEEIPVLCARDYHEGDKLLLRKGACYVRTRGKIETTEIPTQEEMRELLSLATEKGLRNYVALSLRVGAIALPLGITSPPDAVRFEQQLGDFR